MDGLIAVIVVVLLCGELGGLGAPVVVEAHGGVVGVTVAEVRGVAVGFGLVFRYQVVVAWRIASSIELLLVSKLLLFGRVDRMMAGI